MPVFQNIDPLSAASDAVGSFYAAKRQKSLEDAAAAHQAAREGRQDMESDRTFVLDQGRAVDAHSRALDDHTRETDAHSLVPGQIKVQQGEIQGQQDTHASSVLKRTAELQDIAFNKQIQPLKIQAQQIENKHARGDLVTQGDAHRLATLQAQIKQAEASHADQMSKLEIAKQQAEITETQARTGEAYAQTNRINHPVAPRESASERQQDVFNQDMSGLSPQGMQFLDMINGTNNPPTRLQALAAVHQSALPASDKKALTGIMMSHETNFESAGQQGNSNYRDQRNKIGDSRYAAKQGEQLYHDVARGKEYTALSPELKSMVHAALVGQNMSVDDAISALKASGLPDADKTAISRALGAK